MIARPFHSSRWLLGLLTVALRAAPISPPSADPKDVLPPVLQTGATKAPATPASSKSAAKAAPTVTVPVTTKQPEHAPNNSAPAARAVPANSAAASITPPATPEAESPVPSTAAAGPAAEKPGILSAAKAKGPPPVGKAPAAPVPLSPRFQQIRMKIGALFDTRNSPPAPADPLANPFRPAGAVPVAPIAAVEGAVPVPVATNNDLVSLQQAVATLRVKGTIQRGKSLQLTITSAPGKEGTYKEGDIINVVIPGTDPMHVRVRQVSPHSVTLTLGDAEMVLKF